MTWLPRRTPTPSGRRPGPRPGSRPRAAVLAAVALAALVPALASCGIRGTSVPVDAGAAPSRVSCKVPAGSVAPAQPDSSPVTVYLVCSSTLAPVERTVTYPKQRPADRLQVARALLDELQEQPGPVEEEAGFSTAVPEDLEVSGPRAGDPQEALRLSVRPEDLPSFALAQLACTFGESGVLGRTHAAVLGGPGDGDPQRYACSAEVRTHPESVPGTAWGSPAPGN
ncbi:hypothetical protein AB0B21_06315 [Streptomyces rimosus]|uniref:hypothetical protein n=1 Tax=Streptomyces rimosus TaxID=1927 RepID=UPI0009978E3C|nr:hypothetical protein [Streptomyces rimosus]